MSNHEINLTPAELKAVQEHKYFLSQQRGTEVSVEEAIEDFLKRFAEKWRQEKLRLDNLEQRNEIEKHKYYRSLKEGRDVGRGVAASEWCEQFAHVWRVERESLERQGFQRVRIVVHASHSPQTLPWSNVAHVASHFDCDIYVHKDGMTYWNFLLEGRPYMNIKSILNLLSFDIEPGGTIEFIALGATAAEALAALEHLLTGATTQPPGN